MLALCYSACLYIVRYIVYLSDTALECVLQELLRVVYTGIALSSVSRTGIMAYR